MLHGSFDWNDDFFRFEKCLCECYMRVLNEIMDACSLSNVYANVTRKNACRLNNVYVNVTRQLWLKILNACRLNSVCVNVTREFGLK
jgi:hypothetical protein